MSGSQGQFGAQGQYKVAVVGAGPSGLFAAQALLASEAADVHVDVFDRLPTPYGLVRYGVAPDHASIKAVTKVFDRVLSDPRVRFFGLVELGRDMQADELLAGYDAVVYAVGASDDRPLGIPGEELPGSHSAREVVAWYSGHPDADAQHLTDVRRVVTFGVGNVAVDVARILLADPEHLDRTDIPQPVLDELAAARIEHVTVVGRRGPQDASFTTTELRELLGLPGVAIELDASTLDGIAEEGLDRRTVGNLDALRAAADKVVESPRATLRLLFWRRPVEFVGPGRLAEIVLESTALDADGRLVGTGAFESVAAELALRAIGYRARPLPGVPFDTARAIIPNAEGRVLGAEGRPRPGEYVAGWIKRGPVGVIGTNKSDAAETVRHLLADLAGEGSEHPAPTLDVPALLADRGVRASSFADWQRIDEAERARGQSRDRARTKVETWDDLTAIALADDA